MPTNPADRIQPMGCGTAIFTDSGGVSGNYSSVENGQITFCPVISSDKIAMDFTVMDIDAGDTLTVYDGDSTSSPLLATFSGTKSSPGTLLASTSNTSGCLTFKFVSNSNGNSAGWRATRSCVNNCQSISPVIKTDPPIDSDNILRICQGQNVSFEGDAVFSEDGSNATYEWDFDNGQGILNGQNQNLTFTDPGSYQVQFIVTDDRGCQDPNATDFIIQVSNDPDFTGTQATSSSICIGETTTITGEVETVEFVVSPAPPVSGTTFLPDGNGTSYQTCIDVNGFPPGARITSASDVVSIFMDIEHTWTNDLDIILTSPSGASIEILQSGTTGNFKRLGNPNMTDSTTNPNNPNDNPPGTGTVYTISESGSATSTFQSALSGLDEGQSLAMGEYRSNDPFSSLIGSNLNGQWCLTITDNLPLDNGYLFEWGINFDPSLLPVNLSFQPQVETTEWLVDATIISQTNDQITVQPTDIGTHCYTYRLIDSFGCEYDKQVCIEVNAQPVIDDIDDIEVCLGNESQVDFNLTTLNPQIRNGQTNNVIRYFNSESAAIDGNNPIGTDLIISNGVTVYARLESNAGGCFDISPINFIVTESPPIRLDQEYIVCRNELGDLIEGPAVLDTQLDPALYTFEWFVDGNLIPSEMNATLTTENPGTYEVRVVNVITGCEGSRQTTVRQAGEPDTFDVNFTSQPFDDNQRIEVIVTGPDEYLFQLDDGQIQSGNIFDNVRPGPHTITISESRGCGKTIEQIYVFGYPKFFTPNGDGFNDTWNVAVGDELPDLKVFIFDRYGKLMKSINATDQGWDGNYRGAAVPSSDYWFKLTYNLNGTPMETTGHFALKR